MEALVNRMVGSSLRYVSRIKKEIDHYQLRLLTPYKRRHDDVYIVSYPKSGNTWLSFLIGNILVKIAKFPIEINLFNLHSFVPDIGETREVPEYLFGPPYWRFIKSHSYFNPYYRQVIFLVRDPRDVMISYYRFMADGFGYRDNIATFIRDKNYGIARWTKHTASWLENVRITARFRVVRFEDLKRDTLKEISSLVKHIGLQTDDSILDYAIEMSSFQRMKQLDTETVTDVLRRRGNYQFIRSGKAKQFETVLSDSDKTFIIDNASGYMKALGYLEG